MVTRTAFSRDAERGANSSSLRAINRLPPRTMGDEIPAGSRHKKGKLNPTHEHSEDRLEPSF